MDLSCFFAGRMPCLHTVWDRLLLGNPSLVRQLSRPSGLAQGFRHGTESSYFSAVPAVWLVMLCFAGAWRSWTNSYK